MVPIKMRLSAIKPVGVWVFLHNDDFPTDYAAMRDAGVTFHEEPRHEVYGSVVVWSDPFGNRWDLLQLKA